MERDDECPFSKLPSPIITDILIRLPTENIVGCRCVCKSWFKLLSETEFVNLHLQRSQSQSKTRLIINNLSFESEESFLFNLVEVKDDDSLSSDEQNHDFQYVPGSKMEFPKCCYNIKMVGSVKGLVCLNEFPLLHLWNPTMRQFITIPSPNGTRAPAAAADQDPNPNTVIIRYGFGTTLITGQYKVVRIFQELENIVDDDNDQQHKLIKHSECQVFTLGEGSWRNIGNIPFRYYNHRPADEHGLFLNGKIHWLIDDHDDDDDDGSEFITCLDLETEVFLQPIPPPPGLMITKDHKATLNLYKGCLCVCDNTDDSEIVIWIMNEYEKLWNKQVVITKIPLFFGCPRHVDVVRIIKVFKDGTMLLLMRNYFVCSYHPEDNSLESFDGRDLIGAIKRRTCMFEEIYPSIRAMDYVSTILSLKNFGSMETVVKFL